MPTPTITAMGSQDLTPDGTSQFWYIEHDEPDTDYSIFMTVKNCPRDGNGALIPWELGNVGTSGWRIIFSEPPPAPNPPFTVYWIVVRNV